jgi:hypothetical protein
MTAQDSGPGLVWRPVRNQDDTQVSRTPGHHDLTNTFGLALSYPPTEAKI